MINSSLNIFISNNNLQVMLEKTASDLKDWKMDMHSYEKNKRTKKPFGKSLPQIQYVTHHDAKNKEMLFNPILQTYKHKHDEEKRQQDDQYIRAKSLINHLKQGQKYERQFDIVNLHSSSGKEFIEPQPIKKLGPVRHFYNVINNTKLAEFHFRNRELKVPVDREKNLIFRNLKDYNILSNIYHQNDEEKKQKELEMEKEQVWQKYWKTHDYDPVMGKFYDENKEMKYQCERKLQQQEHGKDSEKNLPPSYIYREGFIGDPTKPLPEALKTMDERKINAMRKFQLKYVIQDDHGKRNIEDDCKYEHLIKSKVHNNRIREQKTKQFDIISNKMYKPDRAEELFGKKLAQSTWQKVEGPFIKTCGFRN